MQVTLEPFDDQIYNERGELEQHYVGTYFHFETDGERLVGTAYDYEPERIILSDFEVFDASSSRWEWRDFERVDEIELAKNALTFCRQRGFTRIELWFLRETRDATSTD